MNNLEEETFFPPIILAQVYSFSQIDVVFKSSFYNCYVFIFPVDDVQVSCYRILTSLYALGTGKNIYVERYLSTINALLHETLKHTDVSSVCSSQAAAGSWSVSGHSGGGHAGSLFGAQTQHAQPLLSV